MPWGGWGDRPAVADTFSHMVPLYIYNNLLYKHPSRPRCISIVAALHMYWDYGPAAWRARAPTCRCGCRSWRVPAPHGAFLCHPLGILLLRQHASPPASGLGHKSPLRATREGHARATRTCCASDSCNCWRSRYPRSGAALVGRLSLCSALPRAGLAALATPGTPQSLKAGRDLRNRATLLVSCR